jgi:hypothetical protein
MTSRPHQIFNRSLALTVTYFFGITALMSLTSSVTRADDQQAHFDVNDISFLFPAPNAPADVDALLSLHDQLSDGLPILADATLAKLLDAAAAVKVTASSGQSAQITFSDKASFLKPQQWKIVAIRVDPSAPGTDPKAIAIFGSSPQIRLIVQPVTLDENGAVKINDFAMHLVFDFIKGFEPATIAGLPQRAIPDKDAFRAALEHLKHIKALSEASHVSTAGKLGVHPGLAGKVPGLGDAIKAFVTKNLKSTMLGAIAFMGVQSDAEPWIFFAMVKQGDQLIPFPHPTLHGSLAQMLTFRGGAPVVPAAANTNFVGGVSTRLLFDSNATNDLNGLLFPGNPRPELRSIRLRDIPDIVANPHISNFPNTDCVSCHSESARRQKLNIDSGNDGFAFQAPAGISGVDEKFLPTDDWNVRNFGWSPFNNPPETVTKRTANETAACADFINREYFGQTASAPPQLAAAQVGAVVTLGTAPDSAVKTKPDTTGGPAPVPVVPAPAAQVTPPVSNALTLIMTIKGQQDSAELKKFLLAAQNPGQNQINIAMNKLGIVHFARFVFLDDTKLAVITNFDGSFERYIGAFTEEIGPIFDELLKHMADAPPTPVQQHPKEFLKYVQDRDLSRGQPGYSAYPQLKVQDILTLKAEADARGK